MYNEAFNVAANNAFFTKKITILRDIICMN